MNETRAINDAMQSACIAATLEVLETMFFELPVEEPSTTEVLDPGPYGLAEVEFHGTADGRLRLAVADEVALLLTESFLATDAADTPQARLFQVLGELANMLCGNALGRFDPHGVYRLSTPTATQGQESDSSRYPATTWTCFPLEAGKLYASMFVDAPL
jgi:CheY-specific phosphatase CheX